MTTERGRQEENKVAKKNDVFNSRKKRTRIDMRRNKKWEKITIYNAKMNGYVERFAMAFFLIAVRECVCVCACVCVPK